MSRLPTVGGDDDAWGDILNDFLGVSLNSDGTLKTSAVDTAGAVMNTDFNAKGDLLTASADNTPTILPVGTDGKVLTADAGETTGLTWAEASGGLPQFKQGYGGTETFTASGDGSVAGGVLWGYTGKTALVEASAAGAFAFGPVFYNGGLKASSDGAFALGYVYGWNSDEGYDAGAQIEASDAGAFALGNARGGGHIFSSGYGSFAMGYAGEDGQISSEQDGSVAIGRASDNGIITARERGAVALGFASQTGGQIDAGGQGSFAGGYAYGAVISAGTYGSFAFGYGYPNNITSNGKGSFAVGFADSAAIAATANNSAQFGPGTNAQTDSLQVGTQVRLKGTDGAPGTPKNGDIWLESGVLKAHSGGVTGSIQIA